LELHKRFHVLRPKASGTAKPNECTYFDCPTAMQPPARPVLSKYFTSAKSTSLQMQHSLGNANA